MSRLIFLNRAMVSWSASDRRIYPKPARQPVSGRAPLVSWMSVLWLLLLAQGAWRAESQTASAPPVEVEVMDDSTIVISWPDLAPGFILQESDSPGESAAWKGVLQSPVQSGGRMRVTRSIPSATTRWFYRIRAKGPKPGLDFLAASQNTSGTWGDPARTEIRDTAAAVEALGLYGQQNTTLGNGISGLWSRSPRNNDDASRKAIALLGQGYDASSLLADLLAGQNSGIQDSTALSYPGRGWGLAPGFGNSTIDTALVIRALCAAGRAAGLCVMRETVPAGTTTTPHSFNVPAGGNSIVLRIRNVTGATLRFLLTPPGGGSYYADVSPRTTVYDIVGFPYESGSWNLKVQNSSGLSASYTAEVGFNDAAGFDTFRFSTALSYLGLAQNVDGGWGIGKDEDNQFMITAEVLRALAACGGYFVGPQALNSGAAWLSTRQNPDGGFSSEAGLSNPHETSLAVLAIRQANPSAALGPAITYLKSVQLSDGSWGSDPYQTAMAAQALRMPPVVAAIPGQSVIAPAPFAPINLDDYVTDPAYPDSQITWGIAGNSVLSVALANHVATITYPPGTTATEQLTFTATNPDGLSSSTTASFSVLFQPVDYVIARGGSVSDARVFSGSEALMSQVAYFTEAQRNIPAGVTYTLTGIGFISNTEIQVDFRIEVTGAAALGIHQFQVEYGLQDASHNPLTPLTGNIFNFSIQVTP